MNRFLVLLTLGTQVALATDIAESKKNSGLILKYAQTLGDLPENDPYRSLLLPDPDTGKTTSRFLLLSQVPWSISQSGGSCYGHAAAELLSAAYRRATRENVPVDGDLLAKWYTLKYAPDWQIMMKYTISVGGLLGNLYDGGWDNLVIEKALSEDALFVRDENSIRAFKAIGSGESLKKVSESAQRIAQSFELVKALAQIKPSDPVGGLGSKTVPVGEKLDAILQRENVNRLRFAENSSPFLQKVWNDPDQVKRLSTDSERKDYEPTNAHHPEQMARVRAMLTLIQNYIPASVGIITPGVFHSNDGGVSWQKFGETGMHGLHAVVLLGYAIFDGKPHWIFRNHWEADGKSFIRIPFSETYRIFSAFILLLPQERFVIDKLAIESLEISRDKQK